MNNASEASARDVDPRALVAQLLFIAIVLGLALGIATAPTTFRDGDVSWQVAAGEWILQHGRIPTADPFSFTAAGHPWVAMEWLGEILFGAAFRLDGYAGLATIVAAALMAVNAIIFFYLQRRISTPLLAAALLMLNVVLAPFVLARPHVLSWPLLAGWTIQLLKSGETGRPPPLWTAIILGIWTNVHASFPVAIAIGGLIGLDSLMESRWRTLPQWLAFAAVSAVAILLNANGLAGLLQPFRTVSSQMLPYIGEWHPSSPHSTPYFFAVLLLGLGGLLWAGVRVPLGRLVLLLVLLGMAFAHVRHQSTFIIVACCVIPPLCRTKPAASAVSKWFLLGTAPLLAYRALWPFMPPESEANPRSLLAAVPAQLRTQPVLNGYTFGGPLILAGIKPYIDGRTELYGDAFVRDYMSMTDGDAAAFGRAVRRFDIRWTMLPWGDRRLIAVVESSPGWRRLYADRIGVIDVRGPADAAASPRPQRAP